MKYNFCTLFDSVYLSRGLAMYDSLAEHCEDFHLYVFAFDEMCYEFLKALNRKQMTVISLAEFEDAELLKIKPTRTRGEYCWTCSSSTILYVLNNYNTESCTYIDSDLYFFSSPKVLFDEMGNNSVLITPHNYTAKYDQSNKTGIYCVQFVTFKNDERGLKVLHWWRNACLNWCYDRFENGWFGDQKYLDDWTERFEGVYVCSNPGAGVAPWNMQQYSFSSKEGKLMGTVLQTNTQFDVIFFHFHSLMFVTPYWFSPRPYYNRNDSVLTMAFNPYVKKIKQIRRQYPEIRNTERYLKGVKLLLYIAEVFVRRGFREFHNIKLVHRK